MRRRRLIIVTCSVYDIPRLCECDWCPPDYSKPVRAWTRLPDPRCQLHQLSMATAGQPATVAA
jgi:hypothetical protein